MTGLPLAEMADQAAKGRALGREGVVALRRFRGYLASLDQAIVRQPVELGRQNRSAEAGDGPRQGAEPLVAGGQRGGDRAGPLAAEDGQDVLRQEGGTGSRAGAWSHGQGFVASPRARKF